MAAEGCKARSTIARSPFWLRAPAYPRIPARGCADTVALARREQPDIAVLIDSWGFTLRIAQGLKRALPDLPVVKYVGPQVWAAPAAPAPWLRTVDRLLSIQLPSTREAERAGLATTFVGNPACIAVTSAARTPMRARLDGDPDDPILWVLPGSRPREIEKVGLPFLDAAARLKAERLELRIVPPVADGRGMPWSGPGRQGQGSGFPDRGRRAWADAMKAATVALACSGTVTTELALAGCPMVVGYRVGRITYPLIMLLISYTVHHPHRRRPGLVALEFLVGRARSSALARSPRTAWTIRTCARSADRGPEPAGTDAAARPTRQRRRPTPCWRRWRTPRGKTGKPMRASTRPPGPVLSMTKFAGNQNTTSCWSSAWKARAEARAFSNS